MKVTVYNLSGKATKEIELNDSVFNVAVKPSVVHEVFVAQTNNSREPWADTKNRGEVRGGGKKPWQQKGTGRARHGSIRSPIWRGGGVAFGPLSVRNYHTKINKKTKTVATRMCLTDKAANGALWVMENFSFAEPKTKLFVALLKALPAKQKNFLVVTAGKDTPLLKMTNNVQAVKTMRAEDVTVADLLSKQAVLASLDAIAKLSARLVK
ncbi:MAG: 50S ribosomal protein L4 [Candidatus Magasanikbacteria bacterium GW2011_GWA2_50_22]|uniref:Large ribosomal subunit protein uL4 n=1 Tax=Candidatus Magasanikbacteria bacterium GW2011_GWA2_50_22 TaxID=1619043 RepID=A0A0G1WG77_9BACT|nr:MAG: 50S ribosomal protein L4 [Candidatus Magasanikbacteria bacterium GW2011_GWA2_50_22]